MKNYPVNLSLAGCLVVVVGAGAVGQRKIARLALAEPDRIRVVDPALAHNERKEELLAILGQHPHIPYDIIARPAEETDFIDATLAFAATNNTTINQQVADFCKRHKVLCNRADAENNDFTVPALVAVDDIIMTLSTGGASPALAKQLRLDIESLIGKRYSGLCGVLQRIRPLLLGLNRPTSENTMVFTQLVKSPLGDFLAQNNKAAAHTLLAEILPEALHIHIEKVLYDV